MTLMDIQSYLTRDALHEAVKSASRTTLVLERKSSAMTQLEGVQRICLHINSDGTSCLTLHNAPYNP